MLMYDRSVLCCSDRSVIEFCMCKNDNVAVFQLLIISNNYTGRCSKRKFKPTVETYSSYLTW